MECQCGCLAWVSHVLDLPDAGYPRAINWVIFQDEEEHGTAVWLGHLTVKAYDCETLQGERTVRQDLSRRFRRYRYVKHRRRFRLRPVIRRLRVGRFTIEYPVLIWPPWGPWTRTETELPERDVMGGLTPCWDGGPGCP